MDVYLYIYIFDNLNFMKESFFTDTFCSGPPFTVRTHISAFQCGSKEIHFPMTGLGKGILPLIRMHKSEFPATKQQWYADDDGSTVFL